MRKIYLTIIKALDVVALSMVVVAGIPYVGGNQTKAGIAREICLCV
ncbi:MAG: hypothetical protein ABI417_18405 [Coleofasciculaceae cyanobacterium]